MTTRAKRLQPIVEIEQNKEQEAARLLGEARKAQAEREGRLVELTGYRDEYARLFAENGAKGIDIARLQSYRGFLSQLNDAIEYQRQVIERGRQEVERRVQLWFAARSRVQALEKVQERYRLEEERKAARREQLETDERAQRYGGQEKE